MMKYFYIRKLLFSLVTEPELVEHATGWKLQECNTQKGLSVLDFSDSMERVEELDWYELADHRVVHFIYGLLDVLDVKTLSQKAEEVKFDSDGICKPFTTNNIPNFIADESTIYWARKPSWSIDEATLLSMGFIDSDEIFMSVTSIEKYLAYNHSYYPILKEFFARKSLFQSAIESGHIGKLNNSIEYLEWLEKIKMSYPCGLKDSIYEYRGGKSEQPVNRDLNPKECSSLLALIHAMATNKPYSYDPNDSQNGAIKRIKNAVLDAGLSLSDKTIRKYLREANSEAEKSKDKNQ
ncbi:MAG: hypothetical protein JKY46_04445 [Robiginitomaculum sp.]|nr:hypothetical protein [Robiginitomaculum sp.]